MANPNFNTMAATTLQKYAASGQMADQIFRKFVFLDFLNRKARKGTVSGRSFVVPVMSEENDTVVTFSGYDHLDLTPQEVGTAAEYNWKRLAVSVAISGEEEEWNSGKEEVISLLKAKTRQAEMSAAKKFNTMFITSDGTGNGGKDWLGLEALVGDLTHGPATLGGITVATDTWWQSPISDSAVAITVEDVNHQYNECTAGGDDDGPDFELTTQTLWEAYVDQLQGQQVFENPKLAEAGFRNIVHRGAPVTWDTQIPTGRWYFLNSNHLWLNKGRNKWMNMRKFVEPADQEARFALIISSGQLVTDERRRLGALYSRTAS
jgi:hypothetical protein